MRRPPVDSAAIAVLLTVLVAYGPLSTDLYLPSLPDIRASLGATTAQTQLTLSVFLVGFAVANLIYGPLSDRFGRRPVLLAGLALFVVASLACLTASSIALLLAARFLQALGACAGPVLARAMARDIHTPAKSAELLSYMASAMAIAPIVGPVLGGVLTDAFGWRATFALLTGIGTATLVATALMLAETNNVRDPRALKLRRLLVKYRAILTARRFWGYMLVVATGYASIFAFISGSSFVLIDHLGLSASGHGLAFAVAVLGYVAGSFASARLTVRVGMQRMLALGTGIMVGGGAVTAGLAASPALAPGWGGVAISVLPMAVVLMGCGFAMPNAQAGAIAPYPRFAGTAAAMLGFCQMAFAAGVGIAVGRAVALWPSAMGIGVGACALGAFLAFHLLVVPGERAIAPRHRNS